LKQQNEKWLSEFGARLKAERERQGLTQKVVAQRAGTKQEYVAQIESGARNPSLRTVVNIVAALDVSADHLIFGAHKGNAEGMETLINEFTGFLMKRDVKKVAAYFEIVRFHSKFVDAYGKGNIAEKAAQHHDTIYRFQP